VRPGYSPLWSILVATLASREEKFLKLMHHILVQAEASSAEVEVVALQNQGEQPLASYREALMRAARGKYMCFVDDDDWVSDDYVAAVVRVLEKDPDVVGWQHWCTGLGVAFTSVSITHRNDDVTSRRFTHINPVRTELAVQGTFIDPDMPTFTGEDAAFVRSVLPLLQREVWLEQVVYTYRWSPADSTQSGPIPHGIQCQYAGHRRPAITSPCFRWAS
jgi:hypothetical protein